MEFEHKGKKLWAHTNNTGGMLGLLRRGAPVLVSPATSMRRKLAYTLERVRVGSLDPDGNGFWVGVNTLLPNRMLGAAFAAGALPFARGYTSLTMEARHGQSRIDARLDGAGQPPLWVECKNVTLVEDSVASFPDAASQRARRHLGDLAALAGAGQRGAMFFLVQRPDGKCFAPADYIDPEYARSFYLALEAGVEMYAWRALLEPDGTRLGLPIRLWHGN